MSSSQGQDTAKPPFDQSARPRLTDIPHPTWQVGDGIIEQAPHGVDTQVYNLFKQSRTSKGQEELFRRIDPNDGNLAPGDLYKLMIGGIVPRPIGFCSTLDENAVPNLAPFSYFQAAGTQPPMISLYFTLSGRKDSYINIKRTKEFTVSIISEPFIEASNYSAIDSPAGMSEWSLTGLTQAPSHTVKPPRVAESAYSMECELEHIYEIKHPNNPEKVTGVLVLGRVKLFHIRNDAITERGSIDLSRLLPVSRLGGVSYGRSTESYEMPRPKYEEEKDKPEFQEALRRGENHT